MNRVHSDFPAAGGEALQACLLRQAPGAAQSLSPRVYKQISPCMLMLGSFCPQSKFLITTGAHCPQQVARIVQIIPLLRAWALWVLILERVTYSADAEQRGSVLALPENSSCLKAEKAKGVWKHWLYGSISLSTCSILLDVCFSWVVYSDLYIGDWFLYVLYKDSLCYLENVKKTYHKLHILPCEVFFILLKPGKLASV